MFKTCQVKQYLRLESSWINVNKELQAILPQWTFSIKLDWNKENIPSKPNDIFKFFKYVAYITVEDFEKVKDNFKPSYDYPDVLKSGDYKETRIFVVTR